VACLRFDCIAEDLETQMSLTIDFVNSDERFTPVVAKLSYWRLVAVAVAAGVPAGTWAGLSLWLTGSGIVSAGVFAVSYGVAFIGLAVLTMA
jgi:hypothetical protein